MLYLISPMKDLFYYPKHAFLCSTSQECTTTSSTPGTATRAQLMILDQWVVDGTQADAPPVSLSDWRKGLQWFEVHRKIAVEIISDVTYYPVFRDHCRPPCCMDEHYFATLVSKICPELNSNWSITWVDWSRGCSHPATFVRKDVSEKFLNRIRHGFNCSYNDVKTTMCFLLVGSFIPILLSHC